MKSIILIAVGSIFIGFFVTMTNGHPHCICKCPPTQILGNLSNPDVFEESQLAIVERLWNQTYPVLTNDTIRFRDVILRLARSDVPRFRFMAFIISAFGWSAAPFIDLSPDLCAYAQVINQTVNWILNPNCTEQFAAIARLTSSLYERANMMLAASVRSARCGIRELVPETYTCYANGTVYMAKKLWQLSGGDYPCALQKAALKLYRSDEPIDQLFAAMATAGLSEILGGIVNNFPGNLLLQSFTTQTIPRIPSCCCSAFIAQVRTIRDLSLINIQVALNGTRALFPRCNQ